MRKFYTKLPPDMWFRVGKLKSIAQKRQVEEYQSSTVDLRGASDTQLELSWLNMSWIIARLGINCLKIREPLIPAGHGTCISSKPSKTFHCRTGHYISNYRNSPLLSAAQSDKTLLLNFQ